MSGTYSNKVFLLDEAQLEADTGIQIDDFDTLVELASGHVESFADQFDRPWVEVLAVTSERFNKNETLFYEYRTMWCEEMLGWTKTLAAVQREFAAHGLKSPDELTGAFEDEAYDLSETAGPTGRKVLVEIAHVFE